MSNQEWWAAERKAAEFWRKVKANLAGAHEHNSLKHGIGAAPSAQNPEFGAPTQRKLPDHRYATL